MYKKQKIKVYKIIDLHLPKQTASVVHKQTVPCEIEWETTALTSCLLTNLTFGCCSSSSSEVYAFILLKKRIY